MTWDNLPRDSRTRVAFRVGRENEKGEGVHISAVQDSGTNVDVVSMETAEELERLGVVKIYKKEGETEYIEFGKKGAREKIVGYIRGNGLMGELAVCVNIRENLIGVRGFTKRGMIVDFQRERMYIIYKGSVVLEGEFNESTGLYDLDLIVALEAEAPRGARSARRGRAAMTARRKPRYTARATRLGHLLHQYMMHLPFSTMAKCVEDGAWQNVDPEVTPALLRDIGARRNCLVCAESRWNQIVQLGTGIREHFIEPGEEFTFDGQGKIEPPSRGCSYYFVIVDQGSTFIMIFGAKDKTAVMEALRRYVVFMLSHGFKPRRGRCDYGSVEVGAQFQQAMAILGLEIVPAAPYNQKADPVERTVQTLQNDIAANVGFSTTQGADKWLDAAEWAATMRNCTVNSQTQRIGLGLTAMEIITKRPVDVSQFMEAKFGDVVVVKTTAAEKKMGRSKNQLAIFLGLCMNGSGAAKVKLMDSGRHCIRANPQVVNIMRQPLTAEERKEVRFKEMSDGGLQLETKQMADSTALELYRDQLKLLEENSRIELTQLAERLAKGDGNELEGEAAAEEMEVEEVVPAADVAEAAAVAEAEESSDVEDGSGEEDDVEQYWAAHVSKGGESPTMEDIEDVLLYKRLTGKLPPLQEETECDDSDLDSVESEDWTEEDGWHPPSRRQANKARRVRTDANPTLNSVEGSAELQQKWQPAMTREFTGFLKKALKRVTKERALEVGVTRHVTDFSTKRSGKEKARINVDGREELRKGVFQDRDELHSPAMDEELFKVMMAYGAHHRLKVTTADVVQCFLNTDMEGAKFSRPIVIHLSEFECGVVGGAYYEILAVSYGCADASGEWYRTCRRVMLEVCRFKVSQFFPALFYKRLGPKSILIVGMATDDALEMVTDDELGRTALEEYHAQTAKLWEMTHDPHPVDYIGVDMTFHPDGSIGLIQSAQLRRVHEHFYKDSEVPITLIPLPPGFEQRPLDDSEEAASVKEMQAGLGVIGYLRITRHDGATAMSMLAEHNQRPAMRHLEALKWFAAYLLTSHKVGLTYQAGPAGASVDQVMEWHAFSDCSWGTSPTCFSRLGWGFYAGNREEGERTHPGRMSAAVVAKSVKEKGPVLSDSASGGELQGAMKAAIVNEIFRGVSQELAGVADEGTVEPEPLGAGPPTHLSIAERQPALKTELEVAPTELLQDNASLAKRLNLDTTNKAKGLRRLSRQINFLKGMIQRNSLRITVIGTKQMKVNPLTKMLKGPTEHWREAEWVQGSSAAVTEMQELAAKMAYSRRSQRRAAEEGGKRQKVEDENESEEGEDQSGEEDEDENSAERRALRSNQAFNGAVSAASTEAWKGARAEGFKEQRAATRLARKSREHQERQQHKERRKEKRKAEEEQALSSSEEEIEKKQSARGSRGGSKGGRSKRRK